MRARDLIDRFGREEEAFLKTRFVAPVTPNGKVRVRIAGIVCELSVRDPRPGVMVLRPRSIKEAEIVREATKTESRRYLKLFPSARLIAMVKAGAFWMGIPSGAVRREIRVEGLAPIFAGREVRLFQAVRARFDGSVFLFERAERPAESPYLREQLSKMTEPDALKRKGLLPAEREAYSRLFRIRQDEAIHPDERRLRRALELAGAGLRDYRRQGETFIVDYRVDGQSLTAIVERGDLTVVSSGICLSDRDRDFDLTSLVSVMREGRERGEIE